MRKPDFVSGSADPGRAASDPAFEARFPALFEHLSCSRWEDGSPRETSTLMVVCEQGCVKLGLNDRALGRSTWVSADCLDTALQAIEDGLSSGRVDWRVKQQGSTRKR
jgi:hypothetical protein